MKKYSVIVMIIALMTLTSFAEPASWAVESYFNMTYEEVLSEDLENLDKLKNNITREEFAELAVRIYSKAKGIDMALVGNTHPFTDTANTFVGKAYNLGIVNGISSTAFAPQNLVTREQIATMFYRLVEKIGHNTDYGSEEAFVDQSEISTWAREAVEFSKYKNIIKGVGGNKFAPKENASREQAIVLANNILTIFDHVKISKPELNQVYNGFKIRQEGSQLSVSSRTSTGLMLRILSSPIHDQLDMRSQQIEVYEILRSNTDISYKTIDMIINDMKSNYDEVQKLYLTKPVYYIDLAGNVKTSEPVSGKYISITSSGVFTIDYNEK